MAPDKASGYSKVEAKLIRRLLGRPPVALGSHWLIQSLLYMDRTERSFKVLLDIGLTIAGRFILGVQLSRKLSWTLAFMIAHTMNFLFNGHVWGVLKHYGRVSQTWDAFTTYVDSMVARVRSEPSLEYAAVYGSLGRDEWQPSSDLDMRLVRKTGWYNAARACLFALAERTRALFLVFPLDLYVLDSFASLDRMRMDETPVILLDVRVSDP